MSTQILCCGSNYYGQLGISINREGDETSLVPFSNQSTGQVLDATQVRDIQCGSQFTVVISKSGEILLCGCLNGRIYSQLTPVEIRYPVVCRQIACGRKHILALMEGGHVFSWGTGFFGQLGQGDDNSWDSPRLLRALDPRKLGCQVSAICCGGSHSGAVTENGVALMWGLNRNGQTGTGSKEDSVLQPWRVDLAEKVAVLVCGRNHSACLSVSGRVYTWGAGGYGRLTHADNRKKVYSPVEATFFRESRLEVINLTAGDFHTIATVKQPSPNPPALYCWGYGLEGQTGNGGTMHLRLPRKLDIFDMTDAVSEVSCGSTWSMVCTTKGHCYTWGYNDGGWTAATAPRSNISLMESELPPNPSGGFTHTYAFDSRHNILRPALLDITEHLYEVLWVRAGGAHSIFAVRPRAAAVPALYRYPDDVDISPQPSREEEGTVVLTSFSDDGADLKQSKTEESPSSTRPKFSIETLHSWCRHKKQAELAFALTHGADVEAEDPATGNTLLIVACQNGHKNICDLLLSCGADINRVNKKGNSPLHFCFAYGFHELGDVLISRGADEFAVNNEGLTCYEGLSLADLERL